MKNLINHVLFTKDGRRTGNALVVNQTDSFYLAMTDYGHRITLTEPELNIRFWIGGIARDDHKHYVDTPVLSTEIEAQLVKTRERIMRLKNMSSKLSGGDIETLPQ